MLFNVSEFDHAQTSSVFKDYLGMKIWEQRHLAVSKFIQEKNITKIMDIACSEGKLIQRISRGSTLEYIVGIDIDDQTLENTVHNTHPQPIQNDIKYRREKPLVVEIYKGDATFPYPELKQKDVQLITMIEFIQHLKIEKLPSLNHTVFNFLRPKYIMLTTPNKQFNTFFGLNQEQMRHWDHKYQWTRSQFEQYCKNISLQYSYSYRIFGVGQHIQDGSKGFCSQGAVFTRNQQQYLVEKSCKSHQRKQINNILQLGPQVQLKKLRRFEFPFWKENISNDIKGFLFSTFRKRITQNPFQCVVLWEQIIEKFGQSNIGKCLINSGETINKDLFRLQINNIAQYQCIQKEQGIQVSEIMISQQEDDQNDHFYQQSQYMTQSMSKLHAQCFTQY